MGTTMVLTDGATTINMTTSDDHGPYPVIIKDYDLGFPDIREVKSDWAGQDGTNDLTEFHGARVVKLNTIIVDQGGISKHVTLDKLRASCKPNRRPVLTVMCDGWASPRTLIMRGQPMSCVIGQIAGAYAEASLSWTVPSGKMTGAPVLLAIQPSPSVTTGLHFPLHFPLGWSAGSLSSMATAINPGSEDLPWVAKFWGTANNIVISNRDTGGRMVINTTIPAGHFLQIDTANRTAWIDNDPSLSVFGDIDFSQSTWWTIPAESSTTISAVAQNSDTNAICYVDFSPSWI